MTSSNNKKLTYIPLLSGLVLSILLILANYLFNNVGVILFFQLAVTIALGLAVGSLLKDKMHSSYLVAIFALLYAYAVSGLLAVTKNVHYTIFVLLVAVVSLGTFYLSNKFFNSSKLGKTQKLLLAATGFVILAVACSALGLYLSRLS